MLFDTTRENIVQHIRNIYQEAELQEDRTCKSFLQVQTEGNRSVKRNIPNYNLDLIIAIGYRVKSQVAHGLGNGRHKDYTNISKKDLR